MLTKVDPSPRQTADSMAGCIEILSVTSAVPSFQVTQEEVAWRAQKVYPQYARLDSLYTNTGIDTRYACEPREWYLEPRTWEERSASFQRHAMDLLEKVALSSAEAAGIALSDIDAFTRRYLAPRALRGLTRLCAVVLFAPPAAAILGPPASPPACADSS